MELYDYIWKRKSVRKYDMTSLDTEQLRQITQFAERMTPLFPNIKIAYDITADVKALFSVKAPHYFVISSETKEGHLENVGFMFQQMDLYLSACGLGSCWLGMTKPAGKQHSELPFVIALAFGRPTESPHRKIAELKRKSLSDISSGSDDRIDAARVAPSAVNNQGWFFAAENGSIDVFQKKPLVSPLERTGKIDIGIALSHLFVATENAGREFVFKKEAGKEKKGYIYTGTVV